MRPILRVFTAALAGVAVSTAASAQIHQVQAVASAASGDCSDQDSTGLISAPSAHALASCTAGGTVIAEGTADLPTATTVLHLEAAGSVANAAGQVQLVDSFLFADPTHVLAPNEKLLVGVTFTVDESVSAGAVTGNPVLYYALDLRDFYYGAAPAASFTASGQIDAAGSGVTDFSGTIEVRQPFLNAQLSMTLLGSGIHAGAVDATASIRLDLPPGITWTSTSGVLLTVPEPTADLAAATAALSLCAVARAGRRSRSRAHCGVRALRATLLAPAT